MAAQCSRSTLPAPSRPAAPAAIGYLTVDSSTGGANLLGDGTIDANVVDNGEIYAGEGGTLLIQGPTGAAGMGSLSGTGELVVGSQATLSLSVASVADTLGVQFGSGGGTLAIEAAGCKASIGNFNSGDAIDIQNLTYSSSSSSYTFTPNGSNGGGTLVITEGSTSVTLDIGSSPQSLSGDLTLGKDESGNGTEVTFTNGSAQTMTGTAAEISAELDSLNGANIASITISDNNPLTVNVADLTSDATAISKLADQNGGLYELAITDTASDVAGGLAALEADAAHILSITATGGLVVANEATFASDQSALDKIVGGFGVDDSLSNIVSHLALVDGDSHINELTGTSGAATISGGVSVSAPNFTLTGAGTTLTVAENLAYAGGLRSFEDDTAEPAQRVSRPPSAGPSKDDHSGLGSYTIVDHRRAGALQNIVPISTPIAGPRAVAAVHRL
jgi:hypothetical protein